MKKLFILVLAVVMIGSAGLSFAQSVGVSPDTNLSVTTITFNGSSSPVSSVVIAGHRVIGWMLSSATSSTGALYDAASSATATSSTVFGEAYVTSTYSPIVWFPFPKKIVNGLVVGGTTTTAQTQYYTIYYL